MPRRHLLHRASTAVVLRRDKCRADLVPDLDWEECTLELVWCSGRHMGTERDNHAGDLGQHDVTLTIFIMIAQSSHPVNARNFHA